MNIRKFFRKPVASLLKRFYILVNGGYSVGNAYGSRFVFDWRHSLDKKVALELYEQPQIAYMFNSLEALQPEIFIDVGAHAALYSVALKCRFPALEVHAFEPDRTNLCQLYANLFVNGLTDKIKVHEHGISNASGKACFDRSDVSTSRGTRRISNCGNTEIEVRRLDDVLEFKNHTIAIKIDVEGHERQVIGGATELLARNRCFLQIESTQENLALLNEDMHRLGYRHVNTLGGHDHYFTNSK